MMYYIMYENSIDYESIVPYDTSGDVTSFIENKINKQGYRLDDFKVVQGSELHLKAVKTPIKVLLTN